MHISELYYFLLTPIYLWKKHDKTIDIGVDISTTYNPEKQQYRTKRLTGKYQ